MGFDTLGVWFELWSGTLEFGVMFIIVDESMLLVYFSWHYSYSTAVIIKLWFTKSCFNEMNFSEINFSIIGYE